MVAINGREYKPQFPDNFSPGVAIIGCGNIVRSAHIPAYKKYGVNVLGFYDLSMQAAQSALQEFGSGRVFGSLTELLQCKGIEVVDMAIHPEQRIPLIFDIIDAGKHILCQKPFAANISDAHEIIRRAEKRGVIVAVNQNGRWAPPWRIASVLIDAGQIGKINAITHLYDTKFDWISGTIYDRMKHFGIYDYSTHWIDISRCWMGDETIHAIRAFDYHPPSQDKAAQTPWGLVIEVIYENGANVMIRGIGCSETRKRGHLFWIHGSTGTIRGSVLGGDFVELEKDGVSIRYEIEGQWFPDGFAGAIGELFCAIAGGRAPYNSAQHALLTLQITLAACKSADENGKEVNMTEM
jgi:predicted dehydrogenase